MSNKKNKRVTKEEVKVKVNVAATAVKDYTLQTIEDLLNQQRARACGIVDRTKLSIDSSIQCAKGKAYQKLDDAKAVLNQTKGLAIDKTRAIYGRAKESVSDTVCNVQEKVGGAADRTKLALSKFVAERKEKAEHAEECRRKRMESYKSAVKECREAKKKKKEC